MTDDTPKRRADRHRPPERPDPEELLPTGYRTSRRSSKKAKQAKREVKAARVRNRISDGAARLTSATARFFYWVGVSLVGLAALALVFYLGLQGINGFSRWMARRSLKQQTVEQAWVENLLVIGADSGKATGFLAMRVEEKERRITGISIPDAVFVEVPGQGFEAIGDSYKAGTNVSKAAVSNFLGVSFKKHIVVAAKTFDQVMDSQSVGGLLEDVQSTDLSDQEIEKLRAIFETVPSKDVALLPLPVKPVNVGNGQFFEPEKSKIADLLYTWWGVRSDNVNKPTRVLIYNGAGKPGIAGDAARDLISAGFTVVDTKNADRFDYDKTEVLIFPGRSPAEAERVIGTLKVGSVKQQALDQDITDIIVIIGRDYAPPGKEG